MVAFGKGEGCVSVQAFESGVIGRPGDRRTPIVDTGVALMGSLGGRAQQFVVGYRSLESPDSSVTFNAVDLANQMRTRDVVCRRERTPLIVDRLLPGDRWIAVDAPHRDAAEGTRLAADLPGHDPPVQFGNIPCF